MRLSDDPLVLLRAPSICYLATVMADGSPQLTQTWVDTDDEHVIINSVQSHLKVRNIQRDGRVAVALSDPADPGHYVQVRGRVIEVITDGAADHIEMLSRKYTGGDYANPITSERVKVFVEPERQRVQ